jgi:hypothetical protein
MLENECPLCGRRTIVGIVGGAAAEPDVDEDVFPGWRSAADPVATSVEQLRLPENGRIDGAQR